MNLCIKHRPKKNNLPYWISTVHSVHCIIFLGYEMCFVINWSYTNSYLNYRKHKLINVADKNIVFQTK